VTISASHLMNGRASYAISSSLALEAGRNLMF
jgi:hypothetical protein